MFMFVLFFFFFFQAEDGIRDWSVTGVQTCALPISSARGAAGRGRAVDPGALRAARRPRGLRAGAAPGGAEGTAGDGRRTPEAGFGGRQNSVMLSPALSWNADRS